MAKKGDQIVCDKGHVCGFLEADPTKDWRIEPRTVNLALSDAVDYLPSDDGHQCRICKERVTLIKDGSYRVHLSSGWAGTFVGAAATSRG